MMRCAICRSTHHAHDPSLTCVSGTTVRRLMRHHRVTVREIADVYNLTLKRIRHVRRHGGPWDWPLIIEKLSKRGAPLKT